MFECRDCRGSFAPLDEALGVRPHGSLSRGMRQLAAWKGARMSFSDASEDLAHCHRLQVSPAEVARTAHEEGARIAALREGLEEGWNEPAAGSRPVAPPEIACERLVVEIDGTVVLTRSGEEHKNVWVGRAFGLEHRGEDSSGRAVLTQSRYCAGAGTLEEFRDPLRALANRMGARSADAVAAVADGAPALWRLLSETLPQAVQIQDFWHVAEHLAELSRALNGEMPEQWRPDGDRWKEMLWQGQAEQLIGELRQRRSRHRGTKRRILDAKIGYLEAGRHRMDYPRYRNEGWPIGSGAVEGACKHLAKERFGITGARWKRADIHHILALRLAQFNREWDRFCLPSAA